MPLEALRLQAAVLLVAAASLAALAPADAQTVTTSLVNINPTITSVGVDDATPDPTAGGTTDVVVTVVAADDNGYLDVTSVTVGLLEPGSTVFAAQAAATRQSGSGLSATFTKTFSLQYYDPADTYTVKVVIHDLLNLASVTNTGTTFVYSSLVAMSAPSSLSLGSNLNPGDTGTAQSFLVTNTGNAAMDIQVSGTQLTHATETAHLAVGAIKYSLASNMASPGTLTGSAAALTSFSLAKGSSSTKNLYFQVVVPSVAASVDGYLPAGTYTGTLTVTAVADS
jgi:hypothetical protein